VQFEAILKSKLKCRKGKGNAYTVEIENPENLNTYISMVAVNRNKKLREPKNTVTACILAEEKRIWKRCLGKRRNQITDCED
jgi:hypothetical protein